MVRFVFALLSASTLLAGGCSSDDSSGSTGSTPPPNEPSCDPSKKGFIQCGPADFDVTCQPGTFCSDPIALECSVGCASDANCGCGESCVEGSCITSSVCGDGKCNGSESASSCPKDCTTSSNMCGNGTCDAGETPQVCPEDCGANPCGNGACDAGETPQTCPADCTANPCGNGMCDAGETPQTCPADCPANPCGDGTCAADESPQGCAVDCKVLLDECNQHCDAYDFFSCFQPGDLQTCYDACEAATSSQLKQFNNCAATGTTSCDLTCFDFL